MDFSPDRRAILRLMATGPLLAVPAGAARANADNTVLIGRLIRESRALPRVSQRMDFISGKLLGVRYRANTLIGGPTHPEKFVVRDDAFDCVTFCEVVLAAAIAPDLPGFETSLRRIRYDHGTVEYGQRNHYFADWCSRNVENGICRPVPIEPAVVIDKTVTWHHEFGKRRVTIRAVSKATMMKNAKLLEPGDIVGFTSRRASLDYYHTGLVAFAPDGTLLLRDASQSHGRVVQEKMATFTAVNPVEYVTLLRAADNAPLAERH